MSHTYKKEYTNTCCNMATREECLRNRRERDRLRMQMETAKEREARYIDKCTNNKHCVIIM